MNTQELRAQINHFLILHPGLGRIFYKLYGQLFNDHHHMKFFKQLKQLGFQPKNILDIGANRAEWAAGFTRIFPNTHCFLIEPQQEMIPYLQHFCNTHLGSTYFLCGAGPEKSELQLSVWNDFAGSSMLGGIKHSQKDIAEVRSVPVLTINDMIKEKQVPMPDLIKIDVQGYEVEVLKGASDCFGKTEFLILEVSLFEFYPNQPLFHDIIKYLENQGYLLYDVLHMSRRPYDSALGQMDVCFIHKNSQFKSTNQWD